MKNKIVIGFGVIVIVSIMASLWYFYEAKKEQILFNDVGRQLTENFLKENKTKATYKMVFGGNNYYKYFKEEKEVTKANGFTEDLLPAKLKSFITNNCPEKIYTPNNEGVVGTFSKYVYQLDASNKYNFEFIEILVDEPATEIVCYWIHNDKTGTFDRIDK